MRTLQTTLKLKNSKVTQSFTISRVDDLQKRLESSLDLDEFNLEDKKMRK